MYSLIGFSNAVVVEAFVFQASENRIRAVVAGLDDAVELRRIGSQWFSETGECVSFEFLVSDAPGWADSAAQPMTSSAAS